jgi:predicted dehydrogenase
MAHVPVRPAGGKLRVGIVGAGDISQYHLAAWRRLDQVELVAVCDRDAQRARNRAQTFGIPLTYTSAAEMLAAERLDVLDVATWRQTHGELVRLAADHGVHVLCQKPLMPTLAEAEQLARDVGEKIRLMVHENRRFAPHFRVLKSWIEAGRIGELRQCILTVHRAGLIKSADGTRPSVQRAPYMATESRLLIAETFIHQFDVLRFLLGPLRVIAARTLCTEPDLPGETVATIFLETPAHVAVVVAGSMVAPGFGVVITDRLELIGSRASAILTEDGLELRGEDTLHEAVDFKAAYQPCFDSAMAHFVEALLDGTPFETSLEDNLQTLRLVEDAYDLSAMAQ